MTDKQLPFSLPDEAPSLPEEEGLGRRRSLALVPRLKKQGYDRKQVAVRRAWIEQQTSCGLPHVGSFSVSSEEMRGNVENPIGVAQVPLGVAGPLRVVGEHAEGDFFVPLATTEGALVRSYERGMVVITRSGGVTTRLLSDQNRVCPMLLFEDVAAAAEFSETTLSRLPELREVAASTTHHGRLLGAEVRQIGRRVILDLRFFTADAQGMNMSVKAAEAVCQRLKATSKAQRYTIFSGYDSEKRASGSLFAGGKGKRVTAGVRIPRRLAKTFFRVAPEALVQLWQDTVIGHIEASALGYNGHLANGLTAVFIACGQDVANVANAAVGITTFEVDGDGDLYASVTLPSMTVATVGGGTAQGTARECLEMLGCYGTGGGPKLAEIVAGTLLAGELSFGAAIVSQEFVAAHETLGRNRPRAAPGPSSEEES
ncbi:MAG: hydroxymethylglutaryl-CoA reductase [Deltaproteobacteria bacterium]|nr:hydroxymethylglutaryl-CoA reductase [Deltaproteobacteria bacterium]